MSLTKKQRSNYMIHSSIKTLIMLSSLAALSTAQAGSCNLAPDYQDINYYQGNLGVSVDFAKSHLGAVGKLKKFSASICTGTLIEGDRFITAGHCLSSITDEGYSVAFDYQTGLQSVTFPVTAILEKQRLPLDYAIMQLGGSPSKQFPVARLSAHNIDNQANEEERRVTLIQHPLGRVKQIDSDIAETLPSGSWKSDVDVDGGASGSGVLDHNGYLIAIVSGGGCGREDKWISTGTYISEIAKTSERVNTLIEQGKQDDNFGYKNTFEEGFQWANTGSEHWQLNTTANNMTSANSTSFAYINANESDFDHNEQALLVSHPISLSQTRFAFDYHMHGHDINSLSVDILNNKQWQPLWSKSGQQHGSQNSNWPLAQIDISAYQEQVIKLRFRADSQGGNNSYIAIDNLTIDTKPIELKEEVEDETNKPEEDNLCQQYNNYPNWLRSDIEGGPKTHNQQGDVIVYGDKAYVANWYTNSIPGSDHSWAVLQSCTDVNLVDSDQDGVVDSIDDCPNTTQGMLVNQQGCDLPSNANSCQELPQYPSWNHADWQGGENTHHLGGELMVYQGHVYEAKWYTNTIPGSDERWTYIGQCN